MFTERIFDTYAGNDANDESLSFDEFLVCIWCYSTYDTIMMATYLFKIFDIDEKHILSADEVDALIRMVYYNQQPDEAYIKAREAVKSSVEGSKITLDAFVKLVQSDNSIIQPAFDVQSRIIERTTGDKHVDGGKTCWDLYRQRRLEKFGDSVLPDIECEGKHISSSAQLTTNASEISELSQGFLSNLFKRVERHIDAPERFDSRLEEERYVDKLRDKLNIIDNTLMNEDLNLDRVEERQELRAKLWAIVEEIKDAHLDALEAERERDLGIWDRTIFAEDTDGICMSSDEYSPLPYTSEDEIHDVIDGVASLFNDNWQRFVDNYEDRHGPGNTYWEKLYDADQNLTFYFNTQSAQRCYDQQLGNQPPAICEVCDSLIELADFKCFHCDAARSERNKKKYRGRVSLESMALELE